ncbi:nucleotidyltransferase family protein [Actinospica sp.]|jgi:NDP-sugar pyrophosphorylase family protein|uniref:nucleotidyltransferase family protein n=1 Tax=Actinospica sp. TaxID=1872142 RepID=UPI002CD99160|nr:nucleotidyltransferase family protein [Actinospica sp.]HWG23457.1 nucleotidyltransferase family protein [Actinospica sp.]
MTTRSESEHAEASGAASEAGSGAPVTQAIVLAGGKGSRLRPHTDTRPKTLIEIPGTGRTILEHQLDWLAEEGVTDVVVSCGYLAEVLEQWITDTVLPVRVTTAVEETELGRGGGLKFAARKLPRPEEPWYALNADVWTRFSLRDMAALHARTGVLGTLALARPRIPWGVIELDGSDIGGADNVHGGSLIADFVESPPTPWPVNAGVYVFAPEFTPLLPDLGDHERTTFPDLARERKLAGFLIPEGVYWRAIDTAKDLETAARELAALQRRQQAELR